MTTYYITPDRRLDDAVRNALIRAWIEAQRRRFE